MSGVRKRNTKPSSSECSTVVKTNAPDKPLKKTTSFVLICFYGLVFVTWLIGAVALIGYYRAPFEALPITDYVREVKLEGKFGFNQKIAKGTR